MKKYISATLAMFAITSVCYASVPDVVKQLSGDGLRGTSGELRIGLVEFNGCGFSYWLSVLEPIATLWVSGYDGDTFVFAIEPEDGDVDLVVTSAEIDGWSSLMLYDASTHSEAPIAVGTYTLTAGQRYVVRGACFFSGDHFDLEMHWEDHAYSDPDSEGLTILTLGGNGNVSSSGDNLSFQTSEYGNIHMYIRAEQDMEVPMTAIGTLESSTLDLPASGEEASVLISSGVHEIWVNRFGDAWGMLAMDMGSGDDDGGLPEDVTGDGVVNVDDLLAILAAWGATSP